VVSYRFLTTWLLSAARQQAWDVLADCETWPEWWRGVEQVRELVPGDEGRLGSVYRVTWRAPLVPYRVAFDFDVTDVAEPHRMAGAARGGLEGSGVWRLFEHNGVCAVTFDWGVRTTKPWMKALAPLARPLFTHSHDLLMRRGGEDLARRMGVRLLAAG
jgi:Polyketide cyclase / dehydrase and lipid transport